MEALAQQKETSIVSSPVKKKGTPFFEGVPVQRKLSIGASNDAYEVEADRVADKVVGMSDSQVSPVQQTGSLVQRKCSACGHKDEIQKKPIASTISPIIQRNTSGNKGGTASKALTQQINSSKGGGHKMDTNTQNFMETRFGSDFSGVRIHTGTEAVQMSHELNAKAFTVGNDVYFNEGMYSPNTSSGKHLLAHELTHTIQQGGIRKKKIQTKKKAAPKKTIWVNIGFDSSAKANKKTIKKLRKSIAIEKAALSHCCSTLKKACNVQVKTHYDYNRVNKPAPSDGDYDSDVAADRKLRDKNLDNITAPKGGIKILVTESSLSQTWQGKRIFPRANAPAKGVVWNRALAADDTIAHESGHKAGYVGNTEGNSHHTDPDNIMSSGRIRNANAKPDSDWCTKMAATAV